MREKLRLRACVKADLALKMALVHKCVKAEDKAAGSNIAAENNVGRDRKMAGKNGKHFFLIN